MYNTETTNTSFLEMSKFLKMSGIENNLFMLEQKNPSLPKDPRNENLTAIEKLAIVEECRNNIWYFFREIVQIPQVGNLDPIKFTLNPATMAMLYFLDREVNIYELGCRQVSYKTTTALLYMMQRRQKSFVMHNQARMIDWTIQLQKYLPSYISAYTTMSNITTSPQKDFVWYDEAEYAVVGTLSTLDDKIKSDTNHILITTTIGKRGDNKILSNIRRDSTPFNINIYDQETMPTWILLQFNADMLGMSEEYKREVFKSLNSNKESYNREIMLKR